MLSPGCPSKSETGPIDSTFRMPWMLNGSIRVGRLFIAFTSDAHINRAYN